MKSKHRYTKGLVGQFTLYPLKKKFKCTDWTENIEYVNVIIPAGKMANSRKLVSWKKRKNLSGEKKAIEIPAKFFK